MTSGASQSIVARKGNSAAILALILMTGLDLSAFAAHAATVLSAPANFTVSTTMIDFETYPDPGGGSPITTPYSPYLLYNQWQSLGVLVSDISNSSIAVAAYLKTYSQFTHSGIKGLGIAPATSSGVSMRYDFVIPGTTTPTTMLEAGIWVQNGDATTAPSTVEFFDIFGGLLGSVTTPSNQGSNNDFFAGLSTTTGISSIKISDAGYYLTDDLEFGNASLPTPIPAAVWLFGSGLFGLLGIAQKRKKNRATPYL